MPTTETACGLRVLVAEDEALVAALTRAELESLGMTVEAVAPDGRSVVAMARELQPSVIVMDIELPQTDGISAAAEIQRLCPAPVVILTAHPDHENLRRATAAGVGAFVVKPAQAAELDRAITIAMARHADLMEMQRLNRELERALAEVKTLTGLLPICCSCKKIRDDDGYWQRVETYIMDRTDATFTHGYCPDCVRVYFPGMPST